MIRTLRVLALAFLLLISCPKFGQAAEADGGIFVEGQPGMVCYYICDRTSTDAQGATCNELDTSSTFWKRSFTTPNQWQFFIQTATGCSGHSVEIITSATSGGTQFAVYTLDATTDRVDLAHEGFAPLKYLGANLSGNGTCTDLEVVACEGK